MVPPSHTHSQNREQRVYFKHHIIHIFLFLYFISVINDVHERWLLYEGLFPYILYNPFNSYNFLYNSYICFLIFLFHTTEINTSSGKCMFYTLVLYKIYNLSILLYWVYVSVYFLMKSWTRNELCLSATPIVSVYEIRCSGGVRSKPIISLRTMGQEVRCNLCRYIASLTPPRPRFTFTTRPHGTATQTTLSQMQGAHIAIRNVNIV